ncbi:MAG: flagellar basal body-associated FliL family protein [Chthonomonas sp.]|nr:flagellar basal body-associated FliL family protein [Chthonomonas sp.]
MSAPEAEAPKKKGKLPIIIALVAILGGGGFFMTKGKKKDEGPPELKLAKTSSMIELKDEFLVNLAGGDTYLRCKISLLPTDTAKKEEIEHAAAAITDSIYARFRQTSIEEINKDDGLVRLRRQIASDVNWTLEKLEGSDAAHGDKKKKKKKDEEAVQMTAPTLKGPIDPEELEYPEWDSDEGPILKVFFTSFATQ